VNFIIYGISYIDWKMIDQTMTDSFCLLMNWVKWVCVP